MSKKKTILDILAEEEASAEVTLENEREEDLKKQTYCITKRNRELLRWVAFYSNSKLTKQDVVNMAIERYIRENYEEIYEKVLEAE